MIGEDMIRAPSSEDDRAITPNSAANRYDDSVDGFVHCTIN